MDGSGDISYTEFTSAFHSPQWQQILQLTNIAMSVKSGIERAYGEQHRLYEAWIPFMIIYLFIIH